MASINQIYTVQEEGTDPTAVLVLANITDFTGETYDCEYCTRPVNEASDPFSMNSLFQQWLADHEGEYTILSYVPPADPGPQPYRIAKTTPWLRMTDEEAAAMDAVMSETTARLKQIYIAATYLSSDDELWSTLYQMIADQLGVERADQLLAPED